MDATDIINNNIERSEPHTSSSSLREEFVEWLSAGNTEKYSPATVVKALDVASERLVKQRISTEPIWEITLPDVLSSIHKKAINDKIFRVILGHKLRKHFNQYCQLYFEFLKRQLKPEPPNASSKIGRTEVAIAPSRTIKTAINSVLEEASCGLTAKQIYEAIIERGLYHFGAQNPQSVVRVTLDEACEGSGYTRRASVDSFRFKRNENGEKIYFLLQPIEAITQREPEPDTSVAAIEEYIKEADISGRALSEIASISVAFNQRINPTRKYLKNKVWAVAMPNNRYIHRDCIIDFDEATEVMLRILKMQFAMFNGYSNYTVYYEAVQIELAMFLNDNDFNDAMQVYFLARHLFSVEHYGGCDFVFYGNAHIWDTEPEYPKSNMGVLMSFIKSCGGKATKDECSAYLEKVKISQSWNINGYLQISSNKELFQYNADEYIFAETIGLSDSFLNQIQKNLDLACETHPYVVLRAMNQVWYDRLPRLPHGLNWEYLLLQDIIEKHIPEYRAIGALSGQSLDTIKAGVVQKDSPINTMADLVYAYIVIEKEFELPKTLATEELREKLRVFGMIEGNELIYNMHKALNDRRFVWKNDNGSVTILAK